MAERSLKVWQRGSRDHVPISVSRGFQNCPSMSKQALATPQQDSSAGPPRCCLLSLQTQEATNCSPSGISSQGTSDRMLTLCRVAPQIGKNDTQAGILRLRVGKVTLERAHINYKMTFAKITTAAEQTDLTDICSNIKRKEPEP